MSTQPRFLQLLQIVIGLIDRNDNSNPGNFFHVNVLFELSAPLALTPPSSNETSLRFDAIVTKQG